MSEKNNSDITLRYPSLRLMLTVALVGVSAFINVYSIQSILPLLIHDFNATPVQAGTAVGMTVLAVALISPFIGIISDAIGRRGLIVFSVLFLSVPTGLIHFAQSIESVTLFRFLQGLVVPGIAVVVMAYIGEEFRGKAMATLMSAYVAGTILGGFAGRFIVGHLSDFFGWRDAYYIMAAMNLVAAIFVFLSLPKSQYFVPNRNVRHTLTVLGSHLRNRQLLACCAVGACVLFSLVGSFTYINLHLAEPPFLFSPSALANIFVVYLLGVVVTPISSRLIVHFGSRYVVMAALVFSSFGLLLSLSSSVLVITSALAVTSLGIFIAQAANVSTVANSVSEGRSLASGLYNTSYYAGGFIGASLGGFFYSHWAWTGTVVVLIMIQMFGLTIAWRFMRKKVVV